MSNLEHVICNWTTTSQPPQATKHRAGCTPALLVIPVPQAGNKPIALSIRSPARRAAMASDPKADLPDAAPFWAADQSASPLVTKRFATLGHSTPEEGEVPLFKNLDEEVDYLWGKNSRLEKQHKIERQCTRVLGKNTHRCGESLNALAVPLAPKRLTPVNLPTWRSTVMLLDYGGQMQKDLTVFIHRVKKVLEFDVIICPKERDRMMFTKQYLVSDATAACDQYCTWHPKLRIETGSL